MLELFEGQGVKVVVYCSIKIKRPVVTFEVILTPQMKRLMSIMKKYKLLVSLKTMLWSKRLTAGLLAGVINLTKSQLSYIQLVLSVSVKTIYQIVNFA